MFFVKAEMKQIANLSAEKWGKSFVLGNNAKGREEEYEISFQEEK